MRNLKKILALVLALMMVVSMMVTASATSFSDDADINEKYAEAVSVLSGIGVIRGMENEDGSFRFDPKGELNRAQAATIISYVLKGNLDGIEDEVSVYENPFTDVPAWAVPYVLYAHSEGIIIGRTATTFDPNATIKGYELGKMLLIAAGLAESDDFVNTVYVVDGKAYADEADAVVASLNAGGAEVTTKAIAKSDWQVIVAKGLKTAGIWDSEFSLNKMLTREEACYLTFNTMNAERVVAGNTVSLMSTVFPTVGNANVEVGGLSADKFGRPEANVWTKGSTVLYRTYENPVAVITDGTFDYTKTATGERFNKWTFTNAEIYYNGSLHTGANGFGLASLKAPGMIVELYGDRKSNGGYDVKEVVVIDYYFAEIKDVEADKDIVLNIYEAGYVINSVNNVPAEVTVSYSSTQSADYKALKNYAKGDVLALCVKQDWQAGGVNANWGTNILEVKDLEAVTGVVTSAAIKNASTTPVYSQSTIAFNGVEYAFSNQYARQAIDVGAEGTLYLLNGLVVGFAADKAPDAATLTGFVVDHFVVEIDEVKATYDLYGKQLTAYAPAAKLVYAQIVDANGEVNNYLVNKVTKKTWNASTSAWDDNSSAYDALSVESATYTDIERTICKLTATASGIYTVVDGEKTANGSNFTLSATAISNNSYYYNTAKFVSVLGSLSDITVTEGTLAGAIAATKMDAIYVDVTGTSNKTVTTVFYWSATGAAPTPDNIFFNNGDTTTPVKALGTKVDASGNAIPVYTYTVYENGEKVSITTYASTLTAGKFYDYYVDEYGVCVVDDPFTSTAVTEQQVTNVYGNYITDGAQMNDFDVSNVTIVDLTEKANSSDTKGGNGKIDNGEYVTYLYEVVGTTVIELVYIVPAP